MTDQAAIPSVFTQGSVFALLGPNTPEWRKIVKIEMTKDGPQSTVVQDYTLKKTLTDACTSALDKSDSDDTPEEQRLLMTAWQALAMYLSTCEDSDKPGALNALKLVSNLMADGPDDGPMPTGTFGATTQTAAADAKKKPAKDAKPTVALDKNGKPLPPWLQKKKKPADKADSNTCPKCARSFATEAGLINHLTTLHAAREKQAGYSKNPTAQDQD